MTEAIQHLQLHSTSYVVIPARLASSRLPRKLLLKETGKSLLQHTYEAASQAERPVGICVAAADQEIADEVRYFEGEVIMTDPQAASGTDRVAEVAQQLVNVDIIVNVQGDEPELHGACIDQVIDLLERDSLADIATLATPIRSREQLLDPACTKVVFDGAGRALYFSRSPIPHLRDEEDDMFTREPPLFYQHVGLYAYRRDFLLKLAQLPQGTLEKSENLEQLRALASGYVIAVGVVDQPSIGIDTPNDYRAFVRRTLNQ